MGRFRVSNSRAAHLKADDVIEIRKLFADGWTQGKLSRHFGVSVGQIGRITRGEAWQQLPVLMTEQEIQHRIAAVGPSFNDTAAIEASKARFKQMMEEQGSKQLDELTGDSDDAGNTPQGKDLGDSGE